MATNRDRPGRSSALLRYALVWIAGGAVVAAMVVLLVDGSQDPQIVPLRETQLEEAAREARCSLRAPRNGEILDPPVDGPFTNPPLRPGVYDRPERPEPVVAALRRGSIVVYYRDDVDDGWVKKLRDYQLAVPDGTIVMPDDEGTRYEVAATAWRRLLACSRVTDDAVEALRLFRGRFIGRGPDAG